MSKIEVNTVEPQCGTTLTLGANNDFIKLGTGAGFSGGIGTVRWETTPQTGSFGATAGRGYFMNTTSGALTLTLPASPSAGDIVAVKDYAGTFATNNLTIARNGSKMDGTTSDSVRSTDNESLTLVYVDSTQGWKSVEEGTGVLGATFISASGGNSCGTCGNYKFHVFTGPGTFTVNSVGSGQPESDKLDYLVVAGGGSGGVGNQASGGGGGAGGIRFSAGGFTAPPTSSPLAGTQITATATAYPITVGGGGAAAPGDDQGRAGNSGNSSTFSTITSAGGGAASGHCGNGSAGGSGGGGAGAGPNAPQPGFAGNTPPVSPSQGNPGGTGGNAAPNYASGGGGGGGAAGASVSDPAGSGGAGGVGLQVNIDDNTHYYAGGGGGASWQQSGVDGGAGGTGGGGGGAIGPGNPGSGGAGGGSARNTGGTGDNGSGNGRGGNGGDNTGGGGGGANDFPSATSPVSGAGGSGIVIIRYRFQ